ncbi:hypothetical protein MtrunA17_Chr1g0159091 [Medicago truncatula]|uniref:Uncharacterized protein n=1 Tax=Medicago truncatula TaxID=3880 RepID=A0A072VG91_MEDTR|nr:hypothetical protein MTR_1g028710 [Medicago truncatula]RHN77843.1 hypothetical protein MtrunA17_Chr1g0159091 [Medicago truncatula]
MLKEKCSHYLSYQAKRVRNMFCVDIRGVTSRDSVWTLDSESDLATWIRGTQIPHNGHQEQGKQQILLLSAMEIQRTFQQKYPYQAMGQRS